MGFCTQKELPDESRFNTGSQRTRFEMADEIEMEPGSIFAATVCDSKSVNLRIEIVLPSPR